MKSKNELKTYTVTLHGYGCHGGIQKVTAAQFEFWRKHEGIEKVLSANNDYDHAGNGTPEKALISGVFWDMNTALDFSGLLLGNQMADVMVSVIDENGDSLLDETIESYDSKIQAQNEYSSCIDETEEFYFEHDVPKGCYLWWSRSGTGLWFTGEITIPGNEPFDMYALKFLTIDFEGETFIHQVSYKDIVLMNTGYEQSWSEPTFSFFKSENARLKNMKLKFSLY
jgi:hypothetical protein